VACQYKWEWASRTSGGSSSRRSPACWVGRSGTRSTRPTQLRPLARRGRVNAGGPLVATAPPVPLAHVLPRRLTEAGLGARRATAERRSGSSGAPPRADTSWLKKARSWKKSGAGLRIDAHGSRQSTTARPSSEPSRSSGRVGWGRDPGVMYGAARFNQCSWDPGSATGCSERLARSRRRAWLRAFVDPDTCLFATGWTARGKALSR